MTIKLTKEVRKDITASIERYFSENMEDEIGNLGAGALLDFFLEEIGPAVYNKAVADAQQRLHAIITELDIEIHEEESQYWAKFDRARKRK